MSIEETIASCWTRVAPFQHHFVPARSYLMSAVESAEPRGEIKDQIKIVEEYTLFFKLLYGSMKSANKGEFIEYSCYRFLFGAIASHAEIMTQLIYSRHHVQALVLQRPFSEMIDLLMLLVFFPQECKTYVEAGKPSDANKFWHQKVARGKLRSKLNVHIKSKHPELSAIYDGINDYIDLESSFFSTAIHPSFLSCIMGRPTFCDPDLCEQDGSLEEIDAASLTLSTRSLNFSWRRMSQVIGLCRDQIVACIKSSDRTCAERHLLSNRLDFLCLLPVFLT